MLQIMISNSQTLLTIKLNWTAKRAVVFRQVLELSLIGFVNVTNVLIIGIPFTWNIYDKTKIPLQKSS